MYTDQYTEEISVFWVTLDRAIIGNGSTVCDPIAENWHHSLRSGEINPTELNW